MQTIKGLLDDCEDCFFDLQADLGHVVSVGVSTRSDVDLETVASVHQNNLARHLWFEEGNHIVSQTLWRAVFSSAQLPVVHGQEAGDGPAEAAERDTVVCELDHQWRNLGWWRKVLRDVLGGNGRSETHHQILSLLSLDGW